MNPYFVRRLDRKKVHDRFAVYRRVLDFAREEFVQYYPNFEHWYRHSVFSGFVRGEREILVATPLLRPTSIAGIAILKYSSSEHRKSKLCSFYVHPSRRSAGIGGQLLARSTELVKEKGESERIVLTASEEKVTEGAGRFDTFLRSRGFSPVGDVQGKYRKGKFELAYSLSLQESERATHKGCAGMPIRCKYPLRKHDNVSSGPLSAINALPTVRPRLRSARALSLAQ